MSDYNANPLMQARDTPFGLPPFERVSADHFAPAFDVALSCHDAEIETIADSRDRATFDNTIAALDGSGRDLVRVALLFYNLAASETSPALQAVEREMSPRLAAHHSAVYLNARLFARVDGLHRQRSRSGRGGDVGPARLDRSAATGVSPRVNSSPL